MADKSLNEVLKSLNKKFVENVVKIGAEALVLKDVESNVTAVGVPTNRIIRK